MNIDRFLPSQEEFLTKKYIDKMFKMKLWVSHGSGFHNFLDDSKNEDDFTKSLLGKTYDEMMESPASRKYIEDWLPCRFRYVIAELKETLNEFPLKINRTAYLHESVRESISHGNRPDIGKFWGVRETDSWDVAPSEGKGISTVVEGFVSPEDIDWIETIKSRMDYENGDEEEVQLKKGVFPIAVSMYCNDKDEKLPLSYDASFELALLSHTCNWLEYDVNTVKDINAGFCADFADSFLSSYFIEAFNVVHADVEIIGLYDNEDIEKAKDFNSEVPSWTNWKKIELMASKEAIGHSFIRYKDKYYDAESLTGERSLLDLKIFKRSQDNFLVERKKDIEEEPLI